MKQIFLITFSVLFILNSYSKNNSSEYSSEKFSQLKKWKTFQLIREYKRQNPKNRELLLSILSERKDKLLLNFYYRLIINYSKINHSFKCAYGTPKFNGEYDYQSLFVLYIEQVNNSYNKKLMDLIINRINYYPCLLQSTVKYIIKNKQFLTKQNLLVIRKMKLTTNNLYIIAINHYLKNNIFNINQESTIDSFIKYFEIQGISIYWGSLMLDYAENLIIKYNSKRLLKTLCFLTIKTDAGSSGMLSITLSNIAYKNINLTLETFSEIKSNKIQKQSLFYTKLNLYNNKSQNFKKKYHELIKNSKYKHHKFLKYLIN